METLKFFKVREVKSPKRGTERSAGIDFFIPNDFCDNCKTLSPGDDILIPSGIIAKIPEGYMLMAADKSGIAPSTEAMRDCLMRNKTPEIASSLIVGAKIIDEDYPGEIHIHVINVGSDMISLKPGMKIVQFILVPVSYASPKEVSSFEELGFKLGSRTGGFGSTNDPDKNDKAVTNN